MSRYRPRVPDGGEGEAEDGGEGDRGGGERHVELHEAVEEELLLMNEHPRDVSDPGRAPVPRCLPALLLLRRLRGRGVAAGEKG